MPVSLQRCFFPVAIVALLLSCAHKTSPTAAPPKKPNIIFILADDLGYGDVGFNGQQKIRTPQIDKLAATGMRFTQFYSGTSVCAPSRSSFMTGQHTGHTPIRGNKATEPEGQWPLKASAVTVAEILKQQGYVNASFGKWGMGYVGTEGDPLNQGFDRFFGYNCQSKAHNFFPEYLWDNSTHVNIGNTPASQTQYSADLIQGQAMRFLEEHKNGPFFLFLAYTLPHAGLQLPKNDSLMAVYKKQFNEKPQKESSGWNGVGYQPQAYPKATYAAMVGRLDAYVGAVMQKLRDLKIDEQTLVIFASDNGPHREGGNDPDFFNSNGGLRGIKRDLYEGGIRTPMVASWPGNIKPGAVSGYIGAFWDLLPTFAELAGARVTQPVDGISLVPTLLGKGTQKQHEYLYWEFHENNGRQAVRMGNWKAVRLNAITNPTGTVELYNLEKDPSEKNNIAAQNPVMANRMAELMRQAHVENNDFPFFKTTVGK